VKNEKKIKSVNLAFGTFEINYSKFTKIQNGNDVWTARVKDFVYMIEAF